MPIIPKFRPLPDFSEERIKQFWKKVRIGPDNECWPYIGHCDSNGYGRFPVPGNTTALAHRVVWKTTHRAEPTLCVLHKCDNPPCCNPVHLFEGTWDDNNKDRHAKGRTKLYGKSRLGIERPSTPQKLNTQIAEEIRSMRKSGVKLTDLAKQFGVSRNTIVCILNYKWYKI